MNANKLVASTPLPAARDHAHSREYSLWTLAALGFLAYYITVMWHEVLGHGAMLYVIGARHFILTSTSMYSSEISFSGEGISPGARLALVAGPLSNAVLGLVLYRIFRSATRRGASLTLRYFLWLLTALNFFLGFAYLFFSGVFGVGDYAGVIAGWPHHDLLRGLEVVLGTLLCGATVRFFATSFAEFPESLWRLALVPYVSAAVLFCLAGLRIPNGAHLMFASVIPAALLGQAVLPLITPVARRLRGVTPPPQAIATSPMPILIAAACVVVILLTAPGVHFTLPTP
jgi:hypothetical protein